MWRPNPDGKGEKSRANSLQTFLEAKSITSFNTTSQSAPGVSHLHSSPFLCSNSLGFDSVSDIIVISVQQG